MFNLISSFIFGVFFVWFVLISNSLARLIGEHKTGQPLKDIQDDEVMLALNQRQLDSLLINAIEGRLGEIEVDDELKDVLADDFIMIAISYGDGRVRQATKLQY